MNVWPLLLLLCGCATHQVAPCATVAQPAQRFACSQLPVCKYNCTLSIVISDGAAGTATTTTTQSRSGLSIGPQP